MSTPSVIPVNGTLKRLCSHAEPMIPRPSSLPNSVALVVVVVPSLLMTAYPTCQPLTPLEMTAPGINRIQ